MAVSLRNQVLLLLTLFHNSLVIELPVLSAHGALLLRLRVEPLDDAVDVEAMRAGAPHKRAVVSRELAVRTTAVEGHTANTAVVVVGNPPPSRDARPTYAIGVYIENV